MRVLTWNGRTIPVELRKLPPGKYAVESVDLVPRLTEREEAGLAAALASLDAGRGVAAEEVHDQLRALVRKAKTVRKRRRG
jgi:hypothetical protein